MGRELAGYSCGSSCGLGSGLPPRRTTFPIILAFTKTRCVGARLGWNYREGKLVSAPDLVKLGFHSLPDVADGNIMQYAEPRLNETEQSECKESQGDDHIPRVV